MAAMKDETARGTIAKLVGRRTSVRACGMRMWHIFLGWLALAVAGHADQATELAQIHLEVIGGQDRIDALKAMTARGYVLTGGKKVPFTMVAARPNRLRLETGTGEQALVQVTDGAEAPWRANLGATPLHVMTMPEGEGKLFTADAEFDDPLVAGAERGYSLDYAGEVDSGGKKLTRLLVTRKLRETFAVFVDPDTYFIVARMETRSSPGGRKVEVLTRYEDYRPVAGVLIPHKVGLLVDGKIKQVTVVESVEPNPKLTPETFARPVPEMPSVK